jgi:phage baseplate assembly protein W
MTDFTRPISGFRFVQTQRGDTLRAVALRELGDASGWAQLIWLNKLVPPYLTDDPAEVRTGVLLTGSTIRVPSASAEVDAAVYPDQVFQTDCLLKDGAFQFSGGDFATVSGRENLHQALVHRIQTDHGELQFHPRYGANLGRLIGSLSGPVRALVAGDYVDEALREETRIKDVTKVTATTTGDRLSVDAEVVPITGVNLNVSKVV